MFLTFPVSRCHASKEGMMFDAFLPKVFAMISVLEVKLDRVFVVALEKKRWNKRSVDTNDFRGRPYMTSRIF